MKFRYNDVVRSAMSFAFAPPVPHESIAKLREHSTKCDQSDVFVGHIVNGFMIAEDIWIPSHQSNRCNGGEH